MVGLPAQQVLVLVNPRSGWAWSFAAIRRAMDEYWEQAGAQVVYQFSRSADDTLQKVERAVRSGVTLVLVAGGDGTVSTAGRALIGSEVALGVIPVGSGNGFARHFGVPLTVRAAVRALAYASIRTIDVGLVNGLPFLVTCSVAWDGTLVRSLSRVRLRGILPYVLAGVQEFFEYRPQAMRIQTEDGQTLAYPDPLVCTVANLTQYGSGVKIAPRAQADDGFLELVVVLRQDVPLLLANLKRLFDGSLDTLPQVVTRRFQSLAIRRERPDPIQVDGELVQAGTEVQIRVRPGALRVLVPAPRSR